MGTDDVDDYEFHDRAPTLDDAVRLWRQGRAWQGSDTLYNLCGWAGDLAAENPEQRAIWLKSVRLAEAEGVVDRDEAACLIHLVLSQYFDDCHYMEEPEHVAIGDEMAALCKEHGLEDGEDFTTYAQPPRRWVELTEAYDAATEALWGRFFVDAGEEGLWRLRSERRAEYDAMIARAEARLRADDDAAYLARNGHPRAEPEDPGLRSPITGLAHSAFREAMAAAGETPPARAAAANAGFLALRLLDHRLMAGPAAVAPESPQLAEVRRALAALLPDDPLQPALVAFVNTIHQSPIRTTEDIAPPLATLVEAYAIAGEPALAGEVLMVLLFYSSAEGKTWLETLSRLWEDRGGSAPLR